MFEGVMLLMTYLIKYVFQTKQDLNLSVFNMITAINESITLTKQIACKFSWRFDGNSDQGWNNDKCWRECKNRHVCEKSYILNPSTCSCENGKYLASIVDDSAITWDEVMNTYHEKINSYSNKL